MKTGLKSISTLSSSASRTWRGKAEGWDLQDLMAQVRKFRVRSFMVLVFFGRPRGRFAVSVERGRRCRWVVRR